MSTKVGAGKPTIDANRSVQSDSCALSSTGERFAITCGAKLLERKRESVFAGESGALPGAGACRGSSLSLLGGGGQAANQRLALAREARLQEVRQLRVAVPAHGDQSFDRQRSRHRQRNSRARRMGLIARRRWAGPHGMCELLRERATNTSDSADSDLLMACPRARRQLSAPAPATPTHLASP